jgi:hypothetical protein
VGEGGRSLTFIKTGEVLNPDNYTVTVRSAANGLLDHNGLLLDGNGDGITGDDFAQVFTTAPSTAITISIPDFARGAGQNIDVPATGSGIPITLSNGAGVESVELTVKYDPALLTITEVVLGAGLAGTGLVEANLSIPGEARITAVSEAPLSTEAKELVKLIARVPDDTPYRAAQILDITNVVVNVVNEGVISTIADDGLHVAAYLGDASGTGTYGALDGQRILRVAATLDSGFANFLKIDPVIVGDTTGNGAISSLDATRILQEVVGIDQPTIPPLPGIVIPPPVADPLVNLPTDITGTPGSTVTVPVVIDNADLLESVVLKIGYDTNLLDVAANGIRTGSLTSGGNLLVNVNDTAGTIYVSLLTQPALTAGAGSLLEIDFQIRADATSGATAIDLQSLSLNEGQLVLTVEPSVGPDATDGQITIESAALPFEFDQKVEAQPITAELATVTQQVSSTSESENIATSDSTTFFSVGVKYGIAKSPAENESVKFPWLFDFKNINATEDWSRVVSPSSMRSISLKDSIQYLDDWVSAPDDYRRALGFHDRGIPERVWVSTGSNRK